MNEIKRDWPPLILMRHKPAWVRWRDAILTTAAWLLVALMLMSQFRLLVGYYVGRLDVRSLFVRLGLSEADAAGDWLQDLVRLAPYFVVVFLLLTFLSTFGLRTLTRRRQALQKALPQPLSLAAEARNAGLGGLDGYAGAATDAHHARLDGATIGDGRPVDARMLLAAMKDEDQAALKDARSLQISEVHIDAEGKYHVEKAEEPEPATNVSGRPEKS